LYNKEYHQKYRADNKERIAARKKAEYEANKKRVLAKRKVYYEQNKEEVKARVLVYQVENKGKRNAYAERYREANRERINLNIRKWSKNNLHKRRGTNAARYAVQIKRMPLWFEKDTVTNIYAIAKLQTELTGIPHQVDHIVPLQGKTVSGLHCYDNLQIITASENQAKGNRWVA